jgi:hypothetical protein
MAKRVVILGSLGTDEDAKAVRAVARFVADTQPDEVVCIEGSTTLLERLREGYGGPLNVHASTTDESFDAVLDRFGARLLPEFNKVAPGWITTRGHRGQISLSRIGGNTALNAAIKFGTSVVVGHTHRLGIGTRTGGFGGNITHQVTGMEVGHLMNQKRAEYLKSGTGNWQMGFGLLTIDGQHVKPETVPVHRGRFTVDGHTWEV